MDGLCPQSRTSQIWKGHGRGKKRSGRFNAPKHVSWPSCTELLPRPEEVSHCWGWRGAAEFVVTPWKGLEQRTGSAQGSASI